MSDDWAPIPQYVVRVEPNKHGWGVIVEVADPNKHSPDVLADMMRHAVTAAGAAWPEDMDDDLLDELEASRGEEA